MIMTTIVVSTSAPLDTLRSRLTGTVHEPDEATYDELVTPWLLAVPMRPAAVVAARTAEDIAATVRFAGEHGFTVGVQATGHGARSSLAGHLLVSTKALDEVTIHPDGWARVGAGVKWLHVIKAAAPYGLAPLNGSASDVGVVGYTTGGGVGPMVRTFGLAADRVRAFEVVTGDGVLRRVTPNEYPELYFALRGGKGAAGIVTAVELDLVHLSTFYGGAVYYDAADAAVVLARWRTWADALPEQATTSFALLQLPPIPGVPPELAGRMTLSVRFAWTGEPCEGVRLLDELRSAAPVILDDTAVKPYTAIDSVHAEPVDPMPITESAMLLGAFTDATTTQLLAVAGYGSGSPQLVVEVRHLGGAYAQEGRHPSAFTHRAARYCVLTLGMAADPATQPHAERLFAALSEWDTGGVWPNFGPPHDATTARRAYDPQTLRRLAAVTRTYDPHGVLQAGAYTRAGAA
jgi:FAD/FMN-containing dehydrogenase